MNRPILLTLLGLALAQASCAKSQSADLPAPDHRQVPADAAAMRLSFAPVVRKAAPAVVNVFSKRVVRSRSIRSGACSWAAACPRDRVAQSLGSGVDRAADGVIVTNNHVIDGGQEIMVVLADRREFPAKVLLTDPRADVGGAEDRRRSRAAADAAPSTRRPTCRSATWCWPSAIRSASARR